MSNDSQMQNAIMHQILNTAAKRQAQPLPGGVDPNLKLTDVKNIDDARKLARQIVQTQGGDLAALGADNPQLKEVLANLGPGSAPAPAPAAGGPVDTLPNHFHPPGALPPTQHGLDPVTGEQPLPFEDSLPEVRRRMRSPTSPFPHLLSAQTPSLQQALQDGHNACQHNDVSALLHAVQTAVTGEAGEGVPLQPALAGLPSAPAGALPGAGTEVQSQLQQQQQQLSLLSQLQHQLMTQQVKQADQLRHPPIEPSSSPAPPPLYPGAYPAPTYNPAAADVFRPAAAAAADAAAAYHAQEAERALRDMHAKQHNLAVAGAAFSPLASQPPPAHPQPLWANEQPAFSSPLPPAPADAVAAAAAAQAGLPQATRDQLQQFQSIASTLQSEVPEELAAREQAHRIMVDFIAQKNLTNLLTEKLAEKV